MKETWLYTLKLDSITSLEQFSGMLRDYVRTYNTSHHSGINSTPIDRFLATNKEVRKPLGRDWLNECFFNRTTRKVRNDATISIDKISYDVPIQFIGMKVDIRYLPDDMGSAYILYEDTKSPIRKTNKVENCYTKRNNPTVLDYSRLGGEH